MYFRLSLLVIVLLFFTSGFAQYTPDGNTVLLMHFDGNLTDASATAATAEAVGGISFSEEAMFGESVYLDNSGVFPDYETLLDQYGGDADLADSAYYAQAVPADTSYIMVMPDAALDLSGDWTIEAWVMNADNQVWSTGGWVVGKADVDGNLNYVVTNSPGNFQGAFHEDNSVSPSWEGSTVPNHRYNATGSQAEAVDSTENPKEYRYGWLHVTFIHDATNGWLTTATHDAEGTMISCNYTKIATSDPAKTLDYQFHPGDGNPVVGAGDTLYIGMGGGKMVHGYIDELRISNVVRDDIISDPNIGSRPVNLNIGITNGDATGLSGAIWNPYDTDASYPITAEFYTPGLNQSITAQIHYHTRMYPLDERIPPDAEGWSTVSMTAGEGAEFTGEIPAQPYQTVVEYYMTAETEGGVADTIGFNHDWIWNAGRGHENTYMRFVVVKENSLVWEMDFEEFQPDNSPMEISDWGINVETIGIVTYPDDVPDEDVAGESFASAYIQGTVAPGYLEMKDRDHINSTSYTYTHWVKVDTFVHEGFFFVNQNGSRWSHQQEGFDEANPARQSHHWWKNTPGSSEYSDPSILHYSFMGGDYAHPYWQQERTFGYETGKWYKIVGACDYTGDATKDSAYLQVTDEDGVIWGNIGYPLRVPPSYMEGWINIGHRGSTDLNYISAKVDHMKHWNYYKSDEFVPVTSIADEDNATVVPFKFTLQQNYPNPFNPSTEIVFSIPSQQQVDLIVFDVLGRRVKTLLTRKLKAGEYNITWDGTDLSGNQVATGLYFYKLVGEEKTMTKKMLLVK
jgi:hypothetical protein